MVSLRNLAFEDIEESALHFIIFIISFSLAFISSNLVRYILRAHNPAQIANIYFGQGYNPAQNFARILWMMVGTVALYKGIAYLLHRKPNYFRWLIILLVVFSIFTIDVIPPIAGYTNNLDAFHNGEQLAPASAFNHNKGLYKDMFVLHGAGEDILTPSLALRLSNTFKKGTGISWYYLITSLLELVTVAGFMYLLSVMFKRPLTFVLLAIWFTFGVYSYYFYDRDLFTWAAVLLAYYLLIMRGTRRTLAFCALGALTSASLIYALDRGLIVTAISGLVVLLTLFTDNTDPKFLRFRLPRKIEDYREASLLVGSALAVQIIMFLLIGATAYKDFLIAYFYQIPKYDGPLFDYPLPAFSMASFQYWIPPFLGGIGIIMLYRLFRSEKRGTISPKLAFGIIIFLAGIFFLQSGYGRPDWTHVAYATPTLFLSLFYIISVYWQHFRKDPQALWLPIVAIGILFFPVQTISSARFSTYMSTHVDQIKLFLKLPTINDSSWESANNKQISSYITSNSKPNDGLFIFTQQPIYYYLTNRPNPTRFYVPWFADPQPLEKEMLASLKKNPPKYIIYNSGTGWDGVDGSTMEQRDPTVNAWILQNYHTEHTVGGATILSK